MSTARAPLPILTSPVLCAVAVDSLFLPSPLPESPPETPGSHVKGSTEKPDSFIKETYTKGYVSAYVFRIKGFNLVNESWVCSFQYVEV